MKKIKVVHYCNQLSLGGTEKTMELFCKHLDKNKFEVFVISQIHKAPLSQKIKIALGSVVRNKSALGKRKLWKSMNARVPNFKKITDPENLIFVDGSKQLHDRLISLKPDILHVHYSGNPEPPTNDIDVMSKVPVAVTTNQFERENNSPAHQYVKKMFFVSNWLLQNKALWAKSDQRADVIYNPVERPKAGSDLRALYHIPQDAFVIGRVGRPDNGIFDPISLNAYALIQDEKTYFMALSPPENMIRMAKKMKLKNFIAIKPTTDEVFLSKFYNTIDVLAHARRDGETFGCNIAEAMIHGKPVISHLTEFMNAQIEVIGDTGFVVDQNDFETYAEKLRLLKENKSLYRELAEKSKARALKEFEAEALTKKLEGFYLKLLSPEKH